MQHSYFYLLLQQVLFVFTSILCECILVKCHCGIIIYQASKQNNWPASQMSTRSPCQTRLVRQMWPVWQCMVPENIHTPTMEGIGNSAPDTVAFATRRKRVVTNLRLGFALSDTK